MLLRMVGLSNPWVDRPGCWRRSCLAEQRRRESWRGREIEKGKGEAPSPLDSKVKSDFRIFIAGNPSLFAVYWKKPDSMFVIFLFYSQRCVVVQEVYLDGLIAQDGRLQPGDQVIRNTPSNLP